MKQSDAVQLFSLMKAKTQVEQVAFDGIKRRHSAMLKAASDLRKRAKISAKAQPGEFTIDFYRLNEKHVMGLLNAAKEQEKMAATLVPDLTLARRRLEKALQKELALENLSNRFKAHARQEANKTEERQQELFRSGDTTNQPSL